MGNFCQLWLTCGNKAEAGRIAKALLDKKLIACAKQIPVQSDYWWQSKIEHTDEVMLLMESRLDLFDKIEVEVKELHSYDTFNLQATAIDKVSKKAADWLSEELI